MPNIELTATEPRIRVERLMDEADRRDALYDETFWSLRAEPKHVSPVWLYDERGSLLFDEITRLPEYYPTRREREILRARAPEIAARTEARTLVELGSGTSEKTLLLLDALAAAGTLERFVPLDVSEEILYASAHEIAQRYAGVGVHAIVGDFERHLAALPQGDGRLLAFLGSTIGNLPPERRARMLASVASVLGPDDAFLLGVDLVKDPSRIEAAYNDSAGVTEAFLRNALVALNRELGADFVQDRLAYEARWDPAHEWVDLGFRARVPQRVAVAGLDVDVELRAGEQLRLEVSSKFRRERLELELAAAGLALEAWWTDEAGDFAVLLAARDGSL
jgi:L-histidine N-alpha-methyltransferase